jgi:hypothetical protein
VLPKPNKLPKDMYHSKTIIKGLGMDYEKIDVCKNNCMLFMKEHAEEKKCLKCGLSKKTAMHMRWHKEGVRDHDDLIVHPSDGDAWKALDTFDYMLRHLHLHLRLFNLVKTCRLYQPNFKSLLNLIL